MNSIQSPKTDFSEVSPETKAWAKEKLTEDREYIEHRARFGSPMVRAISNLILELGTEA